MCRSFLLALVCSLVFTSPAAEQSNRADSTVLPSQEQIFSTLRPGHPRLLATSQDFSRLKEQVDGDPRLLQWQQKLTEQARKTLEAPPSVYEIPDGLRLLATSRRVVDRVYTLALLYRLNGEKAYAERAWKELEAAAAFPDWNPKHFLDTAEMTHAFAIGYDWLFDFLSAEQRDTLRKSIVEKGFAPGLKIYRAHNGWAKATHNWNQVCNGGLGMGALALAEVEPEQAAEILHSALGSLPLAMSEFAPDGAWKEGPGYWNYATAYNVALLAALDTALSTDFGLSQMTGFRDTGLFPLYLTGPLGRTFNYADGGDRAIRAPQLFWMARKFNQPVYAWYEQNIAAPAAQDLLWHSSLTKGPKEARLPVDKYYRGTEAVTLRSAWEDPWAVFLAFKAGDNKANHSHLDLGSFVLDALGARWAVDLGADDYNLPGYFGGQRWNYYRLRAEGQNTLVINPAAGPDQDPKAATRIIRFDSQPQKAFAIADLTPAYRTHASNVKRGIALLGRKDVLVQDEILTEAPAEVWWFMHTPAAVKIEDDGQGALLSQIGVNMQVKLLSPRDARLELRDTDPLPSSPKPEGQARNEGIRKLTVHVKDIRDCRIALVFRPLVAAQAPVEPLPGIQPLSDW
jgi:hypothetical protein